MAKVKEQGVYIYAQQVDNKLDKISFELIGKAKDLAKDLKTMAFHEEKTQTQLVTEFIEKGVRQYKEQTTLI